MKLTPINEATNEASYGESALNDGLGVDEYRKQYEQEWQPTAQELKWFDLEGKETECVAGVLEGEVQFWYEDGRFLYNNLSPEDIFAKPEYEYQWLYKRKEDTLWKITPSYYKTIMLGGEYIHLPVIETEREVKD